MNADKININILEQLKPINSSHALPESTRFNARHLD